MIIVFDKKFYHPDAVKNTVKAYDELADFNLKTDKNKIIVAITNIDNEVSGAFKDEFCNYVLSETKNIKSHAFGIEKRQN